MRVPGLAWRSAVCAAVFAAAVAVACSLLGCWRVWSAPPAPAADGGVVAVGDGRIRLVLDVGREEFLRPQGFEAVGTPAEVEDLSLLTLRANELSVSVNGRRTMVCAGGTDYQAVRTVPLGEGSYDADAGGALVEVTADALFLSYAVYAGPAKAVEGAVSAYGYLSAGCFVVLGVMLVYAISLFSFKRDEYYLLVFVVYLAVVFATYLIRMAYRPGTSVVPYATAIATVAAAKYCMVAYATYLLVVGKLPRMRANLLAFALIVAASLLRGAASASSMSFVVSEVTRIALVSLTAAVLVWACACRVPGAWILVGGYVVFFASELTSALSPVEPSAVFALWSYTAVFELPFAFSCMLFINRRFACNYRRAERLSVELAALNRTLDQLVEQRTSEALEQRGRRHGLMLNVFHDLRSPLFVLKGCIDILQSQVAEEAQAASAAPIAGGAAERRELLAVMAERVDFTRSLAEDLFTLAKLEDGDTATVAFGRVCISDVAAATARAQAVVAAEKGVRLECSVRDGCWVWGNEEQLRQLVQNLIVNAVFYTPRGGLVRVDLHREGGCVLTSICDTGPGIREEDFDKLFTRYYKAQGNDRKGATGLGLSIALGLAELHKGTIEVSSCMGEGSTFTVRLPLLEG